MKDDDEPSFSEELCGLDTWDHSFWLSRAFMEASLTLSDAMLAGDFSSQYSSSRVVLHVARQGLELFLKAALDVKGLQALQHGHNLDKLFAAYRAAYPGEEFHLTAPWQFGLSLNRDLFPDEAKDFHSTLDQRHRYAASKSGGSFATRETFDPVQTREAVFELRKELQVIEYLQIRSKKVGKTCMARS